LIFFSIGAAMSGVSRALASSAAARLGSAGRAGSAGAAPGALALYRLAGSIWASADTMLALIWCGPLLAPGFQAMCGKDMLCRGGRTLGRHALHRRTAWDMDMGRKGQHQTAGRPAMPHA